MPKFQITSPDGQNFEIEAPEGATEDQALSYFQQEHQAALEAPQTPQIQDGQIMPPGHALGRTSAFFQGFNGTVPFGNRITAGLGAGGAALLTGDSDISALYNDARANQKATSKEHPDYETAGSVAGIVNSIPLIVGKAGGSGTLGGIGNAVTGGAQKVGNFIRGGGSRAANVARGSLVAGGSSGVYGYGASDNPLDSKEAFNDAAISAGLGAGVGIALPVAGAALGKLNTKVVVPAADEIKALASTAYKKAETSGGILKPDITNSFVDSVGSLLPQTQIGRTVGGDTLVTQLSQRLANIKDKPMSLQAAQEVDELLGDFIDGEFREGRLSKQGTRLLDIQGKLRDTIENAAEDSVVGGKQGFEALKEGRSLYATSRRMADVERVLARAEDASVPATAIRNGFRTLKNSSRFRGYSEAEKAAIDKASRTGIIGDVLGVFGSRLGPLAGATAGAAGGPVGELMGGAASYAGSTAARAASTALQKGRANAVTQAVAERAGLTSETSRSLTLQKLLSLPPSEAMAILGAPQQ